MIRTRRPRPLRRPAGRRGAAPGDAALPRQLDVGEGRAQREPGPRAARAAHRRPRRGLHRGDGQGLRARSSPATPSTRSTPGTASTTPAGTPPGRCRCSASATPTPSPTGAPSPSPTCATWPGTRPPRRTSPASWPATSSPTPRPTSLVDRRGQGVPRLRHRHQGRPARAGRAPGLPRLPRARGAHPDRGLRRHLPRARRDVQAPTGGPVARPQRHLGATAGRRCSTVAATGRARRTAAAAWSSASRMLGSLRDALEPRRRLVADPGRRPTARPASWLPAADDPASTEYVDHLCRMLLGKPSDARLLQARRPSRPTGLRAADTLVTKDHAIAHWLFPRLVDRPARLPRPHDAPEAPDR